MLLYSMNADGMMPSMLCSLCKSLPLITKWGRKERVTKGGNYFRYHIWDAEKGLHTRGHLTSHPSKQGVHPLLPFGAACLSRNLTKHKFCQNVVTRHLRRISILSYLVWRRAKGIWNRHCYVPFSTIKEGRGKEILQMRKGNSKFLKVHPDMK